MIDFSDLDLDRFGPVRLDEHGHIAESEAELKARSEALAAVLDRISQSTTNDPVDEHPEVEPEPAPVTRDELKETLRINLGFFTACGWEPTSDPVLCALADYIIGLAPYIADGTVRFAEHRPRAPQEREETQP